jgi:hypothetical protein
MVHAAQRQTTPAMAALLANVVHLTISAVIRPPIAFPPMAVNLCTVNVPPSRRTLQSPALAAFAVALLPVLAETGMVRAAPNGDTAGSMTRIVWLRTDVGRAWAGARRSHLMALAAESWIISVGVFSRFKGSGGCRYVFRTQQDSRGYVPNRSGKLFQPPNFSLVKQR